MQKLIAAMLTAILLVFSGTALAEGVLRGKVVSVRLYQKGAIVKKVVYPTTKTADIVIPNSVDPSTIRVKSPIPVISMSIEKLILKGKKSPYIEELKKELTKKQDKLDDINANIRALDESLTLIRSINLPVKMDEMENLLEFLQKKIENYSSKESKLRREKEKLKEEIAAIKNEIQSILGKKIFQKAVRVLLREKPPEGYKLTLSYYVKNAFWKPTYTVKMETNRIYIKYSAAIQQKSGEQWKDIELSLETKRPYLPQKPPRLYHLTVDIAKPLYPIRREKVAPLPKIANIITSRVSASTETVGFKLDIPKRVTIPPNGKTYFISVYQGYIPAKVSYISEPFLAKYVFIKATVENNTKIPWIRGSAIFFAGNEMLQKGTIATTFPQEKVTIFFGADEGFKVKRYRKRILKGEKGVFSKEKEIAYLYNIEIRNLHNRTKTVTVIDIVPISENKEVKVKDIRLSPNPSEVKNGIVKWQIKIPGHSVKKLTIRYRIIYPPDKEIIFRHRYY